MSQYYDLSICKKSFYCTTTTNSGYKSSGGDGSFQRGEVLCGVSAIFSHRKLYWSENCMINYYYLFSEIHESSKKPGKFTHH